MNNVLAIRHAQTLTTNSNAQAPYLPTKPPSPTAVAINLLNLLKIANTMSHPMYNPFATGKQIPPQAPYGIAGGQMEQDPRRPSPHLGSGSNIGSSGSSINRGPSGGPIPSLMSLQATYRPERSKITVDEDIDRCLDLNISRAKEEAIQTSANQKSQFINVQRDSFPSSNTGMPSYLTSPATQVKRPFSVDSSCGSLDWLPICQMSSKGALSQKYSSDSSSCLGSGGGLFSTSSEGNNNVPSIPGLSEYNANIPVKSAPTLEAARPKYTSESASNILLHFGLEKEDLEQLISYPEDQITPQNLPFILKQIQMEKEKRASTAAQSKPYGVTQPIRTVGEKDSLKSYRGPVSELDQISSNVKVIDYGHTGVGKEVERAISGTAMTGVGGHLMRSDIFKPSTQGRETPQRGNAELKTGLSVSSHSQMSSVSSIDSLRSTLAPSSSGPSKQLGIQTTQPLKALFPAFGQLNKDTDLRRPKSNVPRTLPPKQPEPARQTLHQPQPSNSTCNLVRGVHPGRPGLVLFQRNDNNQGKTQGQGLKAPEQANKPQAQQTQQHQAPLTQKPPIQMHLRPIRPLKQVQQPVAPRGPTPAIPRLLSLFPIRPSLPALAQGQMKVAPGLPPPVFKDQTSAPKTGPPKLPTPAMMQDYAAATPRIFPHSCCLCMKECTNMKDWLSHQNTSLHLESCRLLRGRHPDWDGKTLELLSGPGKATQPLANTLGQKSAYDALSHSLSPRRQRGSDDRRDERFSRSRSRSPRYYGSESRRQKRSSRSRSRSRTPKRYHASDGQRERRSSRSPRSSRRSRRSRSYDRSTSSRHRSRSRSYDSRSPPRKREAKRRSYEGRSSPRRSRERRSPADRCEPQRKRSADNLAKRLLETTAVQSLSKQSDLEAMVKTLAPALLAELAKMKSSSSSKTEKKTSAAKSAKATAGGPKRTGSASPPKPLAESLPPDKVRLSSVYTFLSHDEIFEVVEKFGKVRNVVMCRATLQAVVHFEKEEDANKLQSLKSIQVKGLPVRVDQNMSPALMKPQSTVPSSASQKRSPGPPAKSISAGKDNTPELSGAKNVTAAKLVTKAAGVSGKTAPAVQKPQSPVKTQDDGPSKPGEVEKQADTTASEEAKEENVAVQVKEHASEADTFLNKREEEPAAPAGVPETTTRTEESSEKRQEEETVKVDSVGIKAEDLQPGKVEPTESMIVVSSAESKNPPGSETVTKETESPPAAGAQNPPRSSPAKTFADPTATPRTSVKTEETSVTDSPRDESERFKTEAEQETETEPEDVRSRPPPALLKSISSVKLEEPTSPGPKLAGRAAAAHVSPMKVDVKIKKEEKEIKRTPGGNVTSSVPPRDDSKNEDQPTSQTSVSPAPAVSAKHIKSDSVQARPTVSDGRNKTQVVAVSTVSRKPNENAERRRPARAPVGSAGKPTVAASSTSVAMLAAASGESGENTAMLPHIDEDIFMAITTALREHRQRKGMNINEERATVSETTFEGRKEENIQLKKNKRKDEDNYSDPFDELDFRDFVTVDEISEEMDDTVIEDDSCSLEPITTDITERQSVDLSSGAVKTSTKPSKDCKSSASSSSKSENSTSSSVSGNKQIPPSQPYTSENKISSSSTIKSAPSNLFNSVQTQPSSGQKVKSKKRKPPIISSVGRSTRSSAAAIKSSVETHQPLKTDVKPTKCAMAQSLHHVSAESSAANTVESESIIDKSSQMDSSAERQSSQIRDLVTGVKELKKSNTKEKTKTTDGKRTKQKRESDNNKQIHNSLNDASQEQEKDDRQDRRTETQIPGPEKGEIKQVPENVSYDKPQTVESHEMDIDESTKLWDHELKNQVAKTNDGNEGPTMVKISDDETKEGSSVRGTDGNHVTSKDTNRTLKSCSIEANVIPKFDILLSEDIYGNSKHVAQISKEDQPLENNVKDTVIEQKLDGRTDLLSESEDGRTDEEVYQVIDAVEDQPTTTEAESETEKREQRKKEGTMSSGDERSSSKGRSRSRTPKRDENEKSAKQQDKTVRKYVTQMKDSNTEEEDFEEVVYEVLDSIEDDAIQETTIKESTSRRQTSQGNKEEEITSTLPEESDKSDMVEGIFTLSDSVAEESVNDKSVVTRSNTGRGRRRERTFARDFQEQDVENFSKTHFCIPLKTSTPSNKSYSRHLSKETTREVLDAVEEVVEPTTSKRGLPNQDNKTSEKLVEELKTVHSPSKVVEEEPTYEILDSIEDEVEDLTSIGEFDSARMSTVSTDDDMTTEMMRSLLNEEEEEPIYQIVDSLGEEQLQEEMTETSVQKNIDPTGDMLSSTGNILSCASTVEPLEQTGEDKKTDQAFNKEDPSLTGTDSTAKTNAGREEEPSNKPNGHQDESEKDVLKSFERNDATANKNVLVNLDQVSEEEEDYPDDAVEEKELKKRQDAARKREKDRSEKKSLERETMERRSQSSGRVGSGNSADEIEKITLKDFEKVEVEAQGMVTLDEVGEDEVGQDMTETSAWDGELTEGELLDLVTLDEITEEEEAKIEGLPQIQESQSVDSHNLETFSALTENAQIGDEKDDSVTQEPPSSSKSERDNATAESENCVPADALAEIGEEKEKETVTTIKGQARKRSRRTPVRKSTRGKTVKGETDKKEVKDESKSLPPASLDSSSTLDISGLSSDVRSERTEERRTESASPEYQPPSELPDELKLGLEEEEKRNLSVKVLDKRKQQLTGPEAKRSRSASPGVPIDLHWPPFNPKTPLGKEFVHPATGFFCSLCSVFYSNENTAKEIHCSSQEHYDNLRNYYQRLQQGNQGSLSDSSA